MLTSDKNVQLYADGYDINLRANIKVGEPAVFDINSININREFAQFLNST